LFVKLLKKKEKKTKKKQKKLWEISTPMRDTPECFSPIDWLVLKGNWDGFSEGLSISGRIPYRTS
jgi:hypothetical protein